jgi:hypothetical protein
MKFQTKENSMKKHFTRILSIALICSMLTSLWTPAAFAENGEPGGEFDFSAAKFVVSEGEGTTKINIKRNGETSEGVSVVFKAVDFLSEYSVDYEILDSDGNPLSVTEPTSEYFTELRSTEVSTTVITENAGSADEPKLAVVPKAAEEPEPAEGSKPAEVAESTERSISTDESKSAADREPAEVPTQTEKAQPVETSATGSPSSLLSAQTQYLNLPQGQEQQGESIVGQAIGDLHKYFAESEGAVGIIAFKPGESEKDITVKIIDNEKAESDKIVLFALLATDNAAYSVAPNATTYLNILDDEPYETPGLSLVNAVYSVSEDAPTAEITVRRTSGMDYFTTAVISTVQQTAVGGVDYENISDSQISFVPGESEKIFAVKGLKFDTAKEFGIRLIASDTSKIEGTDYVPVHILPRGIETAALKEETGIPVAKPGETASEEVSLMAAVTSEEISGLSVAEPSETASEKVSLMAAATSEEISGLPVPAPSEAASEEVALMAAAVTVGTEWTNRLISSFTWQYGPSKGTHDGSHVQKWNANRTTYDLKLNEFNNHSGISWWSTDTMNLRGVKSIGFHHGNWGSYKGSWADYYLWLGIHTGPMSWYGHAAEYRRDGRHDWEYHTLDVSSHNGEYHLNFGAANGGYASDNTSADLGNPLDFIWQKYDFEFLPVDQRDQLQYAERYLYNYDKGTPEVTKIKWDNDVYTKDASAVHFERANGQWVNGFYANAGEQIFIKEDNPALNQELGMQLDGVYFFTKKTSDLLTFDETKMPIVDYWNTAETFFVSNHFLANQAFLASLQDKMGTNKTTFKVVPKYSRKQVSVNFHNTDLNKPKDATKNTYILNIPGNVPQVDWGNNGVYHKRSFPINSKITLRMQAAAKRAPLEWFIDAPTDETVRNAKDPALLENYVLSANMSFYPKTKAQALELMPHPNAVFPSGFVGEENYKDYAKKVMELPQLSQPAKSPESYGTTNAQGYLTSTDINSGQIYSYLALPPPGYTTQWLNGFLDANGDGVVDNGEAANYTQIIESMKNRGEYDPIYGDAISGRVTTDHVKWYYRFMQIPGNATPKVREGHVYQDKRNFYDLTIGRKPISEDNYLPIENATVTYANAQPATTNSKGKFTAYTIGLPDAGRFTVRISKPGEGYQYIARELINFHSNIYLPPYEEFAPEDLSVKYENGAKIDGQTPAILDGMLTVRTKVGSSGSLRPSGAKFIIINSDGNEKGEIKVESGVTLSNVSQGNSLVTTLTFNPKAKLATGDRLKVSYADQFGKWYAPIELGYTFLGTLNVAKFVLPIIGSTFLSDLYDLVSVSVPLMGNPLAKLELGSIPGYKKPVPYNVSPPGVPKTEYYRSDYVFGNFGDAAKEFYGGNSTSSDGAKKDDAEKAKDAAKNNGEDTEGSGVKTKAKFNFKVGIKVAFNLSITQRKEVQTKTDGTKTTVYVPYFEELDFIIGADFKADAQVVITLPIGISVVVSV